ncbi:MAG: SET domain-containing protein-lysine N-methyltransferase [Bacteroidota bacterium]
MNIFKIVVVQKKNYAVYSKIKISANDAILTLQGVPVSEPSKYTIQNAKDKHLSPFSNNIKDEMSVWQFLNHSCNANSYFDFHRMQLIALSNIPSGKEICFNYCTTEYDIVAPFRCECGSSNCYGEIKGLKYLTKEEIKKLQEFLAPHLKNTMHETLSRSENRVTINL